MFGYAFDGFPVYSPYTDEELSSVTLDECGGHTTEALGYHYHAQSAEKNLVIKCLVGQYVATDDGGALLAARPPADPTDRRHPVMTSRWLLWAPIVGAVVLTTACASATTTSTDPTSTSSAASSSDLSTLFVDGALTSAATIVDCKLENGSASTCYQFEVASLPSTVDTTGPYCPATTSDVGGIWVWDGDSPGLYELDSDFWAFMSAQGYDFVDAERKHHDHRSRCGRRVGWGDRRTRASRRLPMGRTICRC